MFKCETCEKMYKYKGGLLKHKQKHQGIIYECEKCKKTYTDQWNKERHYLKCKGDKGKKYEKST